MTKAVDGVFLDRTSRVWKIQCLIIQFNGLIILMQCLLRGSFYKKYAVNEACFPKATL